MKSRNKKGRQCPPIAVKIKCNKKLSIKKVEKIIKNLVRQMKSQVFGL